LYRAWKGRKKGERSNLDMGEVEADEERKKKERSITFQHFTK